MNDRAGRRNSHVRTAHIVTAHSSHQDDGARAARLDVSCASGVSCELSLPCLALAAGLFLLLPSCAIDQNKEIAAYRRVLDADVPAGGAGAAGPLAPAEALTLERAILLANQHNEELALRGESYVQSLIDEARAAAAFLPTINADATYSVSHSSGGGGSGTSHSTSIPLRGSISILNLRSFSESYRAAATTEQQRQLLLDLQSTLLLSVAQTFYLVLRAEQSVVVLQNSLTLQTERVRDMQARENLGISRPLDLAQTQADLAATRVSLLTAQNDVANGRSTLAFLIGVPFVDGPLLDQFSPPESVPTPEELEPVAQAHRQDYLATHAAQEAARYGVQSAIREYYPSISFSADYLLYRHPDAGGLWGMSLSALFPIFNAGLIQADVRTAWSRFRQAGLDESLLGRQIHEEVLTSSQNLLTSRSKLAELQTEVAAAQRAYDLSEASYRVGQASNLDRLTAQDRLLNAQLQLTSEQYNNKVFYLDLLRNTGQFGPSTPSTLPPIQPPA
jgi:outer membrane protein